MIVLRKCPGCGWEFPRSYTLSKCRWCSTPFTNRFCATCGELQHLSNFHKTDNRCKPCENIRAIQYGKDNPHKVRLRRDRLGDKLEAIAEASYNNLMFRVSTINYKPLTEEEWLTTCSYFNGCALCKEGHTETRAFFMPFQDGGKYAVWNILPLCSACARPGRFEMNPYKWFSHYYPTHKVDPVASEKIFKFISDKVAEYEAKGI